MSRDLMGAILGLLLFVMSVVIVLPFGAGEGGFGAVVMAWCIELCIVTVIGGFVILGMMIVER